MGWALFRGPESGIRGTRGRLRGSIFPWSQKRDQGHPFIWILLELGRPPIALIWFGRRGTRESSCAILRVCQSPAPFLNP